MKLWKAALLVAAMATGYSQQQPKTFNFDSDATGKPPAGFTSYATGGRAGGQMGCY
jgi:hypothetical protein